MLDGAPPYRVNAVFDLLHRSFDDRVIVLGYPDKLRGDLDWLANSPDLNPMDFFFWGYTKNKAYKGKKHNLETLQIAIQESIKSISEEMNEKTIENFMKRLQHVVASNGRHFENLIR